MTTGILSKLLDNNVANLQEDIRDYIGASSIGSPCERLIWYRYHGIIGEPISAKLKRTFSVGHYLEKMVISQLRDAGLNIITPVYALSDLDLPNFKGHVDGIWRNENKIAIIEIKTARDSSFHEFVKVGLLRWNAIYYAQLQAYMGMSNIHEAYLIALNKDTSDVHDEFIAFDADYYEGLKHKAKRIIDSEIEPERVNVNPCYFMCRACQYKRICHK
jgi:CRISPR/Cas system-associated exonuclease Cas4 (RecB family)